MVAPITLECHSADSLSFHNVGTLHLFLLLEYGRVIQCVYYEQPAHLNLLSFLCMGHLNFFFCSYLEIYDKWL